MEKNFTLSLQKILKYEGGFTNHPLDKGGPTNLGITLDTLKKYYIEYDYGDLDGDDDIDIDDIRILNTQEKVAPIYKKYYWDKMRLDEFPSKIDFLMFDFGVNSGPKNAIKILQKGLSKQYKIEIDGKLGPMTMACVINASIDKLIFDMIYFREDFYRKIVSSNPSQSVFLKGWLNRLSMVSEEVKEFE